MPPPTSASGLGARKLERCNLPSHYLDKCRRAGLHTVEDVMSRMELDIMEELDLHLWEARELVRMVSSAVMRPPKSAFRLLQEEYELEGTASATAAALSTPVAPAVAQAAEEGEEAELRRALSIQGGRLRLDPSQPELRIHRGITELVGPSGIGKTQCCLSLCCEAYLPVEQGGLGGGTFYIDTESVFSADRLIEIAQSRHPAYYNSRERLRELSSHVYHQKIDSPIALRDLLFNQKLQHDMLERNCKLLVLDGIAALMRHFRMDDEKRGELLGQISSQLKTLSSQLGVPCVVTNQVTTRFGATNNVGVSSEAVLVAALGVSWAHSVNTRFLLQRRDGSRLITVAKSPMFPTITLPYSVTPAGFVVEQEAVSSSSLAPGGSVLNMSMQSVHHLPLDSRREYNG